jgi:hypothetical protein
MYEPVRVEIYENYFENELLTQQNDSSRGTESVQIPVAAALTQQNELLPRHRKCPKSFRGRDCLVVVRITSRD